MTTQDIQKELPNLPEKQLKQIRDKCNFLLKDKEEIPDSNLSLFYETLREHNKTVFKDVGVPYGIYKKTSYGKKVLEVGQYLDKYLAELLDTPTRLQRQRWYRLFALVMSEHIKSSPAGQSLNVMLNHYKEFPILLDKQFPDYIESGLFFKLFK